MLLQLDSVYAGYGGGDVLRGVSLTVEQGSITCIVGPNGAGKSTVMATISGLLKPRQGDIIFAGRSIRGLRPQQILARGLALVPQAHSLFPGLTVRENVELGAYMLNDAALVRRRLAEVEALFPIVRERATEKAGSLSGGQQRQVEFARSLMLDPALVMLDEPSMSLDPKTAKEMFKTVKHMNESGRTILLVEQNVRSGLGVATHGVVMESGKVRLIGPAQDILNNPEISALYLGGSLEDTHAS
ncbi:MAG TPA: ABC transporter ATP-binding protein [Ktedonobacterales bacterium]|nr:ABC transporter ATP-binding protein [Ktedonobacterales bacterium]